MYDADVLHYRIELEDDGQPKPAHGGYGIGADADWLENGQPQHESKYQVRIVFDEKECFGDMIHDL